MASNRTLLASFLLVLPTLACASSRAAAPVDEEQMMARWTEFMTPGEAHRALDPKVGNWTMVVRMFNGPGMPPEESAGSSQVQWILDGRYLQDTTTGEFNGMPFRGSGLTGYDNLKKRYVSTWIDNFGTGILRAEGHYDAATHTFHYEGEGPDIVYANTYVPTRATERWIDADHWVMQSFGPDGSGDEYLAMEIQYTRVK